MYEVQVRILQAAKSSIMSMQEAKVKVCQTPKSLVMSMQEVKVRTWQTVNPQTCLCNKFKLGYGKQVSP
jgi:hypothetical protein